MDFDDLPARSRPTLDQLEAEDLSSYSLEDLKDRIRRLQAEIVRAEVSHAAKTRSMSAADSVFKA